MVWAVENGVSPPSYAVLVSKADKLAVHSKAMAKRTCCSRSRECASAYCDTIADSTSNDCCPPEKLACKTCENSDGASNTAADVAKKQEQSETIAVLSISKMKCRGLSSEFNILPWATLQVHSISCSFPEPIVSPFEVSDEWLPSSNSQPAAPPPRFSAGA